MPAGGVCPCLEGQSVGDTVQPGTKRFLFADGRRLFGQHQEHGLEDILRRVPVMQNASTNTQHQQRVAAHDRRERMFVVPVDVSAEQLPVGQLIVLDRPPSGREAAAGRCLPGDSPYTVFSRNSEPAPRAGDPFLALRTPFARLLSATSGRKRPKYSSKKGLERSYSLCDKSAACRFVIGGRLPLSTGAGTMNA
jgi:hypothetical protein